MSQATRKFSGLAKGDSGPEDGNGRRETKRYLYRLPSSVHVRHQRRFPAPYAPTRMMRSAKRRSMALRLPPATLNEPARLEQRANLLRSVRPKHADRLSKDRIHHTESAVRERGDFRERRDVVGPRRAQILEQSDGLGQHAAARRVTITYSVRSPPRIVGRDEVPVGADPPEPLVVAVERDGLALGDPRPRGRPENASRASRARSTDAPRAGRQRSEVEGERFSPAPGRRRVEDVLRAHARVAGHLEAAQRKARARRRTGRDRTPPRARAARQAHAHARSASCGACAARRRRAAETALPSLYPRPRFRYSSPNFTTSPAPRVTSRSPGCERLLQAVDNPFLFRGIDDLAHAPPGAPPRPRARP